MAKTDGGGIAHGVMEPKEFILTANAEVGTIRAVVTNGDMNRHDKSRDMNRHDKSRDMNRHDKSRDKNILMIL